MHNFLSNPILQHREINKTFNMSLEKSFNEISPEMVKQFGKIRNTEDDLSTTIFLNKDKAEKIILNVLGDIFKDNVARYSYED